MRSRLLLAFALVGSVQIGVSAPRLRLSQTAVGPVVVAAGANAASHTIDAANAGDGLLNLQVSSSATWLVPTVGPRRDCALQSQGCLPIQFALRTSGLAAGSYTGIVTVSDPNAVDAPQTVTVTVNVGGNVPQRVDLYAAPNGAAATSRFFASTVLQTAASTQSGGQWLAVATEGAGSFRFGQAIPYRISGVPVSGLGEGTYNGQVVTAGSSIAAENRTIPVTLRVTSQPIAQLSNERLTFRIAQGSARQTQFVSIANRGLGSYSITGATPSGGAWLTAERVQPTLVGVTANPSGLAPGTYSGTVAIAGNAAQGDITVPVDVEIIASGAPLAYVNGVVNNATFEGGDVIAQGAIVAVFGEQFTTGEPVSAPSLPLQTTLAGARVYVNDQPAPVYYVSYGQINFQVPFDAAPGDAIIRVEREGQRGNAVSVRIARAAPRLLRLGIADQAIAVNGDGSFPMSATPGLNARPARRGETLVFYAIGLGPTNQNVASGVASPSSPLASNANYRVAFGTAGPFGGAEAVEVAPLFAGLTPGFVGLYQINVTIPQAAPSGSSVPVAIIGEGGASNRVTIAIQ